MSGYSDGWADHVSRATIHAHSDQPTAKVTYRSGTGKKFRVIVRQRPNPIGFAARLPGDRTKNANPHNTVDIRPRVCA